MNKRIVLIVIVLLLMLNLAVNCVGATRVVKLNMWSGFTGPDRETMADIVGGFNKANEGIQVEFWSGSYDVLFNKMLTSYAAGSPPDVVTMHNSDIPEYAEKGVLMPLDNLLGAIGVTQADFTPSSWKATLFEGIRYGIPLDCHMLATYKNVRLFKEAGLDPNKVFTNKEDFLHYCQKLTIDKNGRNATETGFDSKNTVQWGVAIPSTHIHTWRYWYSLLYQAGGQFLTDDAKKAAFNSEAGERAWQFLLDLVYEYKVAPENQFDLDKDFITEKCAILFDGPWWVPGMKEQTHLEWTTAPFPQVFENRAVWGNGHAITMLKQEDQERIQAATKLVKWITDSNFDWGVGGQIPTRISVLNSSEYDALEYYPAFREQIEYVAYQPAITKHSQMFSDNLMTPDVIMMQSIMLRKASIKDAMNRAEKEVDRILGY